MWLLLSTLTATPLPVIPLILAIVLRRLRNQNGLLRLLDLGLTLRSRHLLLTATPLPIIPLILTIVLRRLGNHHGLLRLLNLRLGLRNRHLLLTAAFLPIILAIILTIVLRRLWNHCRLLWLLEWWLRLLRPATFLAVNRRLRNHRGLPRLLHLRRSLRLGNGLCPILLTERLAFALRIHLTDLATRVKAGSVGSG